MCSRALAAHLEGGRILTVKFAIVCWPRSAPAELGASIKFLVEGHTDTGTQREREREEGRAQRFEARDKLAAM